MSIIKSALGALPTKYRSRVGVIAAALGVVGSILAVTAADQPWAALVIQALTALGFVAPREAE